MRIGLEFSTVNRVCSQCLLDAQQLIVFGDAIRAAQRTRLDLSRIRRHGNVGNGCILGLARAMTDDGGVIVLLGQRNSVEGFGQRTDLIDFYQNRSEEHTSELQSRFGISYAVFCLKKKMMK